MWCAKHLKMTAISLEESQETEHCDTFFQVKDDSLEPIYAEVY